MQLLNILHERSLLDDGSSLDVLLHDFNKAFDDVPHRRLIAWLISFVTCDEILKYNQNFLNDRRQGVIITGAISEWRIH